jgi:hypothetical protein
VVQALNAVVGRGIVVWVEYTASSVGGDYGERGGRKHLCIVCGLLMSSCIFMAEIWRVIKAQVFHVFTTSAMAAGRCGEDG